MRRVRRNVSSTRVAFLAPMLFWGCSGTIGASGEGVLDDPGGGGQGGGTDVRVDDNGETICADDAIEARLWLLTPEQYENTLKDGFGLADFKKGDLPAAVGDSRTGFPNDASAGFLNGTLTNTLFGEAARVATKIGGELGRTNACMLASTTTDDCVRAFISDMGKKAYRRPLEEAELSQLQVFYRNSIKDHGNRGAAEMTVQAMLLSPRFHYRSEIGVDGQLTGWEIASALSYGIADSPPSAALLALANDGKLSDPLERERVAIELAATPRAREKMARFIHWQMKLPRLENERLTLGSPLVDSMLAETKGFVDAVMQGERPDLSTLYTANFSFVDDRIAPIYGVTGKAGALQRTDLPAEERFGLFTQAAFLATLHGPIHRGRMLRENVLCQEIPPPPNAADLINQLPETPAEWTEAEKWPVFQKERAACASCHSLFAPMGLAFEVYDKVGKFRTENEFGRRLDTANTVESEGWSGQFEGPRHLIEQIAESEVGQTCFTRRYLTYTLGRAAPDVADSCTTRDVARRFSQAGGDLKELIAATVADPGFVTRIMP